MYSHAGMVVFVLPSYPDFSVKLFTSFDSTLSLLGSTNYGDCSTVCYNDLGHKLLSCLIQLNSGRDKFWGQSLSFVLTSVAFFLVLYFSALSGELIGL